MKVLITGSAGFIGYNFAKSLLEKKGFKIVGIDNFNDYYDVSLKKKRNNLLKKYRSFQFIKIDIRNKIKLEKLFKKKNFDFVFHFAAQAGVRYSIKHPRKYIESNLLGFYNILENVKKYKVKRLFYASSSSVYGDNKNFPLNEKENIFPKNIYGLSKKVNEEISFIFNKYYNVKLIGLRFFTVFGEWGRPDMLIFKYLKSIYEKKKFKLNADGKHFRDFTYIKDVIKIITKITKINPTEKFCVYNICSNKPVKVSRVINLINKQVKLKTYVNKINSKLLEKIEVNKTHGDNKKVLKKIKNVKFTNFDKALYQTVEWYSKNKIYTI